MRRITVTTIRYHKVFPAAGEGMETIMPDVGADATDSRQRAQTQNWSCLAYGRDQGVVTACQLSLPVYGLINCYTLQ